MVIKQENLLILFMTMLWLLNANWCFQENLGSKLTRRWSDTPWRIFDILSSFNVLGIHWHNGTPLVDHTGFNGGLVEFGVLSKVCLFEQPLFLTPFIHYIKQNIRAFSSSAQSRVNIIAYTSICSIPRRTLPKAFFWRAARRNWKALQKLVVIAIFPCLLVRIWCWNIWCQQQWTTTKASLFLLSADFEVDEANLASRYTPTSICLFVYT